MAFNNLLKRIQKESLDVQAIINQHSTGCYGKYEHTESINFVIRKSEDSGGV